MNIDPVQLFKCLSDNTRLTIVLLISTEAELCVCELTCALDVSQPKISRHLSQLRLCGVLQDRREGQWVYYRLRPAFPEWGREVIEAALKGHPPLFEESIARLSTMVARPERC